MRKIIGGKVEILKKYSVRVLNYVLRTYSPQEFIDFVAPALNLSISFLEDMKSFQGEEMYEFAYPGDEGKSIYPRSLILNEGFMEIMRYILNSYPPEEFMAFVKPVINGTISLAENSSRNWGEEMYELIIHDEEGDKQVHCASIPDTTVEKKKELSETHQKSTDVIFPDEVTPDEVSPNENYVVEKRFPRIRINEADFPAKISEFQLCSYGDGYAESSYCFLEVTDQQGKILPFIFY